MTTARQLPDGTTTEYGCGLRITQVERRRILTHNGMVAGFNACNMMVPSTKSAVIMIANTGAGLTDLPDRILELMLREKPVVPKINGPQTVDMVKKIFKQLQENKVDRAQFADEFNWFLTPQEAAGAAKRLKPYGNPTNVQVIRSNERGGMEVTTTRLTFKSGRLKALMYRRPDGIIEQFFVDEE